MVSCHGIPHQRSWPPGCEGYGSDRAPGVLNCPQCNDMKVWDAGIARRGYLSIFFSFLFFQNIVSFMSCGTNIELSTGWTTATQDMSAYAGTNLQSKDSVGAGYSGLHSKGRWPSEPRAVQISPHFFSCQIANIYTWYVRRHSLMAPRVIRDDCFKHTDTERFGDRDIVKLEL